MPDTNQLGAQLRQIRKQRGLTQRQVADRATEIRREADPDEAPIAPAMISQYETGERTPSLGMVGVLAAALEVESGIFTGIQEADSEHRGVLRSYKVTNTLEAGNVVRGELPGRGATGATAALAKALKHGHLRRGAEPEAPSVELAAIPKGAELVELRTPLVVRIGGEVRMHLPAGWLLVVDTTAEARADEMELVVVERPASASEQGRAEIRRLEIGPRGVKLLFALDSDEAVTESQGWRIVGPVVDHRPPPRKR